jgi:hypothetical protein
VILSACHAAVSSKARVSGVNAPAICALRTTPCTGHDTHRDLAADLSTGTERQTDPIQGAPTYVEVSRQDVATTTALPGLPAAISAVPASLGSRPSPAHDFVDHLLSRRCAERCHPARRRHPRPRWRLAS